MDKIHIELATSALNAAKNHYIKILTNSDIPFEEKVIALIENIDTENAINFVCDSNALTENYGCIDYNTGKKLVKSIYFEYLNKINNNYVDQLVSLNTNYNGESLINFPD